jgi:quercetin dioxygenase-like cupin family protein
VDASSELNANLVHFGTGQGVGEHTNDEVEVIILGVSGSGIVTVDREEHALSAGMLMFMPKGARRSTGAPRRTSPTSPFTVGGDHCTSASRQGA